jgi:hypothetical protein
MWNELMVETGGLLLKRVGKKRSTIPVLLVYPLADGWI